MEVSYFSVAQAARRPHAHRVAWWLASDGYKRQTQSPAVANQTQLWPLTRPAAGARMAQKTPTNGVKETQILTNGRKDPYQRTANKTIPTSNR